MKKFVLTVVLATLCLFFKAEAQSQVPDIKPLKIGDTIPEAIWNMPLQVVNHPEEKKIITLSEYRGKLIILDFWGRYCAPCIKFLPKLDSLAETFSPLIKALPISDLENLGDLNLALSRFKVFSKMQSPVSLLNKDLVKYFPHKLVSHLIWINKEGVVSAITGSDHVTPENIRELLSGQRIDWTVKKDILDFNDHKPLITVSTALQPRELYYSTFTSSISGIAPPNGTYRDSLTNTTTTSFYNVSLLNLCKIAMDYQRGAKPDQFILNVKDTSKYIKTKAEGASWREQNTWCYSIRMPIDHSSHEIKAIVQTDILRWLKILGIDIKKQHFIVNGMSVEKYVVTEAKRKAQQVQLK